MRGRRFDCRAEDAAVDRVTLSEEELNALQGATLQYYIREENYCNGLIADKTQAGSPASRT